MKLNVVLILCIAATVLINALAVLYWHEYFRTLGHPMRWDAITYPEWDCFYNDCRGINGGNDIP